MKEYVEKVQKASPTAWNLKQPTTRKIEQTELFSTCQIYGWYMFRLKTDPYTNQ